MFAHAIAAAAAMNATRIPEVATGRQLPVVQHSLQQAIQQHQRVAGHSEGTILRAALSSQPYGFVSVDTQGTETEQYLDPKTMAPIGSQRPQAAGRASP
ncbi:MAG: hypothetical protein NVSMB32_15560 [Actinomycetota bacterium]